MKFFARFIKKYPLTCVCLLLIWILSLLFVPPHTRLNDVAFIDKWTHLVMYGGTCCVMWWEYLRRHERLDGRRLLLLAWLAPIAMSGVLELLQEYCTTNRSGEWLDLAANATGATLGNLAGLLAARLRCLQRRQNGVATQAGLQRNRG